ncbi:RNA-binding domain-containing protein [Pseudovirgaria hyperparasitica]|uniref:RNA-binding domain-containing protein n=1 Tax=Pseudovirgaria hyperparasitica TaxID=470096 RepID=A0A6A6WBI2_9PEZI|nr:RNA-binding domain-containing protein [Pseudovirgaria hyperparasitica]KAF2759404.1 RNA-binding domain-containing protein [Pseudovirgaria hyperparasitica]
MASSKAPPLKTLPPNQTLYINRLNPKINKRDLRRELYMIFSTYGSVLDIVALRSDKMRGQAHVTFKSIESATQAMRALQGFEFFGSELKIYYAKSKSDTLAKLDGTYKLPVPESRLESPSAATASGMTALQASVFDAPPSNTDAAKSAASSDGKLKPLASDVAGTKRPREEDDEDSDVPMDEDEDEGSAMEESDDD